MPFGDDIIQIQIRENLVVRIQGIPHDLTAAEADRIARVVAALANRPPEAPDAQAKFGDPA